MAWATITATEFVAEGFNTSERTSIQSAAGGDDGLTNIIAAAIAEWRGVMEAAGYDLDADTTKIPPSCRRLIIAQVRWQLLIKFPQLKMLQTEERKKEAETAQEKLERIEAGEAAIEPPVPPVDGDTSPAGNYGGETKIQMRTHTDT